MRPPHYLKQFLPKYSSAKKLTEEAKAAGYANWVQYFHFKSDWRMNTDLPTVAAWRMTQPIDTTTWMLERNPYFYEVDTNGNRLPYLDKVQMSLAENPEVVNLRAIAGEYDVQERFIDIAKLSVFLENADRGHYKFHLDPGFNGSDSQLVFNLSFKADPELAKWIAKWSDFDPAKANAMLDAIGLTKKDRDGYSLRPDNGERLRLQIDVAQTLTPT